jgi:parallel beta-helix repeat protein
MSRRSSRAADALAWRTPCLVVLLAGALLAAAPARAATFIVDDAGDAGDSNAGNGACKAAGNVCTLRAAIEEANALAGADIITFNIAPAGAKTITPATALPTITQQLTIDGTTQPGWTSAPIIEIVGPAGGATAGLTLSGVSNCVIRGLVIRGFSGGNGNGIRILGGSANTIAGNYLGTNLAGTAASGNKVGVFIQSTTGNTVGGAAVADRNVISGNTVDGIQITSAGTNNNVVQGNYIGVDATGTADLGNASQGIAVFTSPSGTQIIGNVIAGNNGNGMAISNFAANTVVQGNLIGTNAAGTAGIANSVQGINLDSSAANTNITNNTIAYNVQHGIWMGPAGTGNLVSQNSIHDNGGFGIELNGDGIITPNDTGDGDSGPNNLQNFPVLSAAMTNGAGSANFAGSLNSAASTTYRIEFFASTAADATGYGEGERYLGFTNVTTNGSGSAIIGVTLAASLAAGEFVTATATDPSNNTSEFSAAIVAVSRLVVTTTADTVDGTTTSVANLIANPGADGRISLREAITAANATAGADTVTFGIPLTDANHLYYQDDTTASSLTSVQTTPLADAASPSSPATTGFDPDYPTGTTRSWYRITLASALPGITSPSILDGTTQPFSAAGTGPVVEVNGAAGGNETLDLQAGSSGSTIRGFVVNRSPSHGIRVRESSNNVIAGNFLGTDVSGTAAGPGNRTSLYIGAGTTVANDNRVGGTTAADRNIISGNTIDGVQIDGTSGGGTANNLVQGNYIGLDVTGTRAVGNTNQGISIFGTNSNTVIGGTGAGAGNVISGNNGRGIHMHDAGTTGTLVQGNKIGTNAAGTAGVPNAGIGVRIYNSSSNNTIGGTAANAGNLIAFNGSHGVALPLGGGSGNSILGNAIYANGGLGIDLLEDGVTANDALDPDTGPNDLLNFPLLTAATASGGTLTTYFKLDLPAGSYRIEFFRNPSGRDGTGFGEGEVFAGACSVTHPGGGQVPLNCAFPGTAADVITATATFCTNGAACTAFGSSSEFSAALTSTPTAVTLLSFAAVGRDRVVDLSWTTASELSNLGFNLYRADAAGGPYTRITSSLIPGLGSSPTGRSYAYRDSGLENGRTYYYELEDVETTGRTERHGPVSATANPQSSSPPSDGSTYGDPSGVVLREIERDTEHVVLELLTPGFVAVPTDDGRVRVSIPGFASVSAAGEPELPSRRAFVEAMAGRKVWLTSVQALETVRFAGLRPAAQGSPSVEVDEVGTVLPSEEKRREGRAFDGVFPTEPAHLLGTSFQGERKKAELILSPLRWDGEGLELSRRLVVRLDFAGREPRERSLGGSRGRRAVSRPRRVGSGLVAQLVAKERGLYALAFEDVFADRSGGISVALLRMSRQGEDVAFHVEPDPSRFAPGSTLYFLSGGSGLNPYGDAVYELETGRSGTLMPVDRLSALCPRGASVPVVEYYQSVKREENLYYQAGLLDAPDLWLWDVIVSPGHTSYPFTADHVSGTSPAYVSISLQGGSDFEGVIDHHVRVKVNGQFVGETRWDGKKPTSLDLELEPGGLREGSNELELEEVGDTGAAYSLVFLNRFTVRYPRGLVATGGTLEGSFASAGQAPVDGLSSSSVLLDTTDTPRWRKGATVTATGLTFPVEGGHSYLATSVVKHPLVRGIQGKALRKTENQADYLLLAPQAFLAAAQPLLDLRQHEGLATMAVSLEDVYEQFGHGEVSPEAIKAFLEYAYQSWSSPSVRYVLLLGDASYDPKDYLGTGTKDWLPGLPIKTSYLWTVSDPGYAAVNGEDALPDIAIGRLPAASADEAARLVEKIVAYEHGARLDGPAILVADNADTAGDFEADAEDIAALFAGRDVRKIYYSQQGALSRSLIEQAFDEGASFVSYVGHGATAVWASENIFNTGDVKNLLPQSRQPVVMTMNCLNGFFHFPPLNSLSEELLKAEGRGAFAAVAPSGLSVDGAAHVYHRALLGEILSGRHARLGDAVLAAQEDYAQSGSLPELLAIYHLFGDPATPLR